MFERQHAVLRKLAENRLHRRVPLFGRAEANGHVALFLAELASGIAYHIQVAVVGVEDGEGPIQPCNEQATEQVGGYGVKLEIFLADLPGERAQEHPDEEEKQQPRGSADGQRPVAEYVGRAEDLVFVHRHEDPPVRGRNGEPDAEAGVPIPGGETDKLPFRLMENILLAGAQHVVWRRLAVP